MSIIIRDGTIIVKKSFIAIYRDNHDYLSRDYRSSFIAINRDERLLHFKIKLKVFQIDVLKICCNTFMVLVR